MVKRVSSFKDGSSRPDERLAILDNCRDDCSYLIAQITMSHSIVFFFIITPKPCEDLLALRIHLFFLNRLDSTFYLDKALQ